MKLPKFKIPDVPLHRTYGARKKVTVFTYINEALASVLAIILIILMSITWVLGAVLFILLMGGIGTVIVVIATVSFVYFKLCRKLRKRIKFLRKLKRKCRRLGYTVTYHRGLFKGLRLNKQGYDLTVDTGEKLWCLRFFTPPKYLCHLVILSKNKMRIKFNITKSRLKFVLGLNDPKNIEFDYTFTDELPDTGKKAERALLLNPVPHELYRKDEDGAVIPTGTGSHIHGYVVFTGTGFLQTLEREHSDIENAK